jgi:hypothetical protein
MAQYAPKPEYNDFVRNTFYKGWNDKAAMEGDWKATGDKKWSEYNRANDPVYQESERMKQEQAKATQSALSTLRGGESKINDIYSSKTGVLQAELDPTKQRYEQLLAEITRREGEEKTAATRTVNREMGRREILSDSGFYDQEMQGANQPISRFYGDQATGVGLEQDTALRAIQAAIAQLGQQQAEQLLGLDRDVAQVQMAGGQNAAQLALSLLGQRQQDAQFQASLTEQRTMQELQNMLMGRQQDLSERKFNELELPMLQYQLGKPYYAPTTGGASSASSLSQIQNAFQQFMGGGGVIAPSTTQPYQSQRIIG